jgi:exopolyphosphatase/pppGpp-phosphohydrolase
MHELAASMDAEERRSIVGLQPERADVILGGACIARTVMAELEKDSATVCDRGLRHGLLAEGFGPSGSPGRPPDHDATDQRERTIARRRAPTRESDRGARGLGEAAACLLPARQARS